MTVTDLAILVVYVVRDHDEEALLALHLERIERHTCVPFRIYAATPRVTDHAAAMLAAHEAVEICAVPGIAQRGSREHAHYLDGLLAHARRSGASHFVTLDLDSFPVADAWHDVLAAAEPSGLAAILRTENLDTVLPHPSCTLLPSGFVAAHRFSFTPDSDGTRDFRRFLHDTHQRADTGIRLARLLAQERVGWHRMRRSNQRELHPVIAGLYDDVVFHLGAGARENLFRADLARSWLHRATRPLERIPAPKALRRAELRALDRIRRPTERRILAVNAGAASQARRWLHTDPDGLFQFLRGQPSASLPE